MNMKKLAILTLALCIFGSSAPAFASDGGPQGGGGAGTKSSGGKGGGAGIKSSGGKGGAAGKHGAGTRGTGTRGGDTGGTGTQGGGGR
jgi:hypothetical protein